LFAVEISSEKETAFERPLHKKRRKKNVEHLTTDSNCAISVTLCSKSAVQVKGAAAVYKAI